MSIILTAEQALNYYLNKSPGMLLSKSLDDSKKIFYDYIFNTIGNCLTEDNSFFNFITIDENEFDLTLSVPEKYISPIDVYEGYREGTFIPEIKKDGEDFYIPKTNSKIDGFYTKDEFKNHPDIYIWLKTEKLDTVDYYPNFSKEYSTLWKIDLNKLDKSWIQEAILFYQNANSFFNSPDSSTYQLAYPGNETQKKESYENCEKYIAYYLKKDSQTEKELFNLVTETFGNKIVFNGDIDQFLTEKWQLEKKEILLFISETIEKLELVLAQKNKLKIK